MVEADLIDAVARSLRRPEERGDAVVARVLDQLAREQVAAGRRRWRLLGPGVAAAAVIAVAIGLRAGAGAAKHPVRFVVAAPASARVTLIGDFNDWDARATPLRLASGEWSVTLRLPPGRYRYAFLVDGGRWVADPGTPRADDDFGTPTSAITVSN